jgi:cation transport ATPase
MNEAMVTGESAPMSKGPGEELVSGTVNSGHAGLMRGSSVSADTLLTVQCRLRTALDCTYVCRRANVR